MANPDYYKILGLEKSAADKDIKAAYRKLARKYHPDVNPDDEGAKRRFQEINEANEVLSDPEKRKKYDEYGKDWKHAGAYEQAKQQQGAGASAGFGGGNAYESFGEGGDFSDFFGSMFGRQPGGRRQSGFRGQDYRAELRLSLRDAAQAQKQTLTVNGKNIRITIPAGVEDGQTIKIAGHGGPGASGGKAGDLLISFLIAPDQVFKRKGNDLYATLPVDLYTAVLGGDLTADTLNGKVKLQVKPGSQNGQKVKLKGKGFPVYKKENETGDLYLTYQVQLPTVLTEKQQELFTELAKSSRP